MTKLRQLLKDHNLPDNNLFTDIRTVQLFLVDDFDGIFKTRCTLNAPVHAREGAGPQPSCLIKQETEDGKNDALVTHVIPRPDLIRVSGGLALNIAKYEAWARMQISM